MRIHHTMGVYNSGNRVHNGVAEAHLKEHIEYNLMFRPGRAFFVDGECLNTGYLDQERVDAILAELRANPKVMDRVTTPYR